MAEYKLQTIQNIQNFGKLHIYLTEKKIALILVTAGQSVWCYGFDLLTPDCMCVSVLERVKFLTV